MTRYTSYSRNFAAAYDRRWSGSVPWLERVFEQVPAIKQNRWVVDLGCGTGVVAYALIEKGFQVLGIDGSENMLEEARRRNAEHIASGRTEFIKADVRDLALNRTFGVATSLRL